jgi:hypothetical protein
MPLTSEKESLGDWSDGGTPGHIPNPVVKPVSADGTWGATPWESRSLPRDFFHLIFEAHNLAFLTQTLSGWNFEKSLRSRNGLIDNLNIIGYNTKRVAGLLFRSFDKEKAYWVSEVDIRPGSVVYSSANPANASRAFLLPGTLHRCRVLSPGEVDAAEKARNPTRLAHRPAAGQQAMSGRR